MGDCEVFRVGKCVSDEGMLDKESSFQVKYRSDSEYVAGSGMHHVVVDYLLLLSFLAGSNYDEVLDCLTRVDFPRPSRILPAAAPHLVIPSFNRPLEVLLAIY